MDSKYSDSSTSSLLDTDLNRAQLCKHEGTDTRAGNRCEMQRFSVYTRVCSIINRVVDGLVGVHRLADRREARDVREEDRHLARRHLEPRLLALAHEHAHDLEGHVLGERPEPALHLEERDLDAPDLVHVARLVRLVGHGEVHVRDLLHVLAQRRQGRDDLVGERLGVAAERPQA